MTTVLYFQSGVAESNAVKLDGFCRYAKAAKWRVQVVPYAKAAENREWRDGNKMAFDIKALLSLWSPAGVVVEAGSSPGALSSQMFSRIPAVFLDQSPSSEETLCVYSDAKQIAEAAARELLAADAASFAYVPFRDDVAWSRERGEAFAEAIRQNGRQCRIFGTCPQGKGHGAQLRRHLCDCLRSMPLPCGVFAANDHLAAIVLECAARVGIKVPKDMAVIGVDNDKSICEHTSPTLSSIISDFGRGGYMAGELLHKRISHPRRKVSNVRFGVLGVRRRESTFAYSRPADNRIKDAVEFIRLHACDRISSRDVIERMQCSRRMAEMRFREVTGHSMLDEIQAARLSCAKELLANTNESVAAIADRCGYSTTEPLRRIFLKIDGMSPLQWRKRIAHL